MESTRVTFFNKDDFYDVCLMLKRLHCEADGADVKYWVLYFKHTTPIDKEVFFKKVHRESMKELNKLMGNWAYGRIID